MSAGGLWAFLRHWYAPVMLRLAVLVLVSVGVSDALLRAWGGRPAAFWPVQAIGIVPLYIVAFAMMLEARGWATVRRPLPRMAHYAAFAIVVTISGVGLALLGFALGLPATILFTELRKAVGVPLLDFAPFLLVPLCGWIGGAICGELLWRWHGAAPHIDHGAPHRRGGAAAAAAIFILGSALLILPTLFLTRLDPAAVRTVGWGGVAVAALTWPLPHLILTWRAAPAEVPPLGRAGLLAQTVPAGCLIGAVEAAVIWAWA
ncbi:MAG TPA: hypothetical protein VEH84_03625 [Alphaproteobacteria bacterium]|nr:hypothetical protein [Alphaproteobacteria bacterium]